MSRIPYDQISDEYARHRQVHPGVLRALVETLPPTCNVLEVGCGTGNYIAAIHAVTGCACWGVDPSPEMLARARERAPGVHLSLGRGERVGLPDGHFDLIYSVDAIHHVEDREAYHAEAHRLLRPGGRLCTVTDSAWIIRRRRPLATHFPESVPIELARYPSIADLRAGMQAAGFFEIEEQQVEHRDALADIQAYREKAYSILHLIPEEAFCRGIARLERDLERGPIERVTRYTILWARRGSP